MRWLYFLLCWALMPILVACTPKPAQQLAVMNLPAAATQVLLVTSTDWDTSEARLQRMERKPSGWQAVGESIPTRVGRNGLGWGIGLHTDGTTGVLKKEGDGKAPAGIFRLGTAFGYAPDPPAGVKMPYRVASERDYFIDAVASPDYNRWQQIAAGQPNEPKQHWNSFERMRRDDMQYEFGLVVGHNTQTPIAGRGSAIFMHVWLNPETATSGCTAMAKADLLKVLAWLDPAAQPLLVQSPAAELENLRLALPEGK